ncbi:MAG: enoyl-CoA hydratase [Deltaproteobacteria bacterium]|jgi:acyl dehydratase|nr:enoyl-CoA hydratase [Deltaproteobacteria bacterium]
MPLNLELIGKKTEPTPFTYNQDSVILYALGVGAGVDELDFVYEKNLKVLPTFAVIPILPSMGPLMKNSGINMPAVLHGEQKIILHAAIPDAGTLYSVGEWESVYDKGDKGAVLNFGFQTYDQEDRLVFENKIVIVDRSAGNFGGDRGPKGEKIDPPEGKQADFSVTYAISKDQAALYRLSGDKNPLHVDPEFAKKGKLPAPILHGLCTYGHAGRAILHSVCDGEPSKLKSFAARFMNVVFPGETITVDGWKRETGGVVIQVKAGDGRLILGNALAELA